MTADFPEGAFAYYARLGPGRSYEAVARQFGVHKRTVVRAADREEWVSRLEGIERAAREALDQKLAAELQERQLRQRKLVLAIASRAAKAISDHPLTDGMQGIKAAELAIKLERLLDGESTERASIDVEQVIRREFEELMSVEEGSDGEESGDETRLKGA